MARKPVRPSLGTVLEGLPLGVALTLLAALPSYFNLATDQIFEEEKSLLLRAGALMALPALVALWRADMRRLVKHPIVLLCAGVMFVLTIATIFAIVPRDALMGAHLRRHGLVMWIAVAVLFVAMLSGSRTTAGRDLIVRALIVGAAWPSAYLLLQRGGLDPFQWIAPSEGFKAGGSFGNHVMLGGYLAVAIPLTALEAYRSSRIWIVLVVLEVAAIIATASRGALLAMAAAVASAGAILLWRFAPRRVGAAVVAATALGAVLLVGVPALRPAIVERQLDPRAGSARVRILIWQDTIDIVRHSGARMLFGHGPESLASLFPGHYSPEIGYWEQIDAMPDRAHNEVLDMLVWAGGIGALFELGLFAAAFLAALRIDDIAIRSALSAAVIAHVVELQFGIASVTTRLCFFAVAALIVGASGSVREERTPRHAYMWVVIAAAIGAASPWLSMLPSFLDNPISSGGEAEFIAYLRYLSSLVPILYGAFLLIAIGMARASRIAGPASATAFRLAMLVAGVWAAAVWCIGPSRADAFAAAGRSYERDQRWPEATAAHRAAAREQPSVVEYQSNLGRTLVQWAMQSAPPMREQLLEQGRVAFQQAVDLNRFDIDAQRRLAAYPRIRASLVQGTEREALLEQADSAYAAVSALAPTSPAVLAEWAWVDVDRGRADEARRKLDIALGMNSRHPAAQSLRQQLK